jgi:Na+/H+-dicarboxylate symporter
VVLVGAASSALCGVFFDEYAAVVEPIGGVYVALVQMAVFPFLVSSAAARTGQLARSGCSARAGRHFFSRGPEL